MKIYKILGTPCFQVSNENQVKIYLKNILHNNQGGYSVAINATKILMYKKDPRVKEIIDNALLPIPDGSGTVLGLKFLYGVNSIRLDFPKVIFELANEEKYKLFILGSSEEVNSVAVSKLRERYSSINIVGRHNGYFNDKKEIIKLLKDTMPQIVVVALGSPNQEKFIISINKQFPNIFFSGIGGALDILAGKVNRASKFYQDNHLEWFYRLVSEPSRIKSQKILPLYFFKLLIEYINRKIKQSK